MSLDYKTPEQVAEQYLLHLKGLKPEVNTQDTDSEWWVRSRVVGGLISGVYGDQKKISNDAFPQLSRKEATLRHLNLWFGGGFDAATQAVGNLIYTGATGTQVIAGQQFVYPSSGNVYTADSNVNFGAATSASIPVTSVNTGQSQNLIAGQVLNVSSPPVGGSSTATVDSRNLSDARNEETNEQAQARILDRIRTPLAGGKVTDYKQFALAADESVVSANILRFPFGFGTVGVVITAGTTDIDAALDNGDPIIQIPSEELIAKVQEYIETQNPETDCATVLPPASVGVNVTVTVKFASGDGSTVLNGQTLTQAQLVQREVKRAIYKTPPGGRKIGASGFVLASEIEEVVDVGLSDSPYVQGSYAQILLDRQVEDLSVTGDNLMILGTQIPVPGTITVVEI